LINVYFAVIQYKSFIKTIKFYYNRLN